jgi:hypothetical protein
VFSALYGEKKGNSGTNLLTMRACCGAILPAPLSRLDAIPGQEHLRRAITVALTGNHPITFLGSGAALADALAFGRISRHYGVTAYVTTPCICGNAGDPYLASTSSARIPGIEMYGVMRGDAARAIGNPPAPTYLATPPDEPCLLPTSFPREMEAAGSDGYGITPRSRRMSSKTASNGALIVASRRNRSAAVVHVPFGSERMAGRTPLRHWPGRPPTSRLPRCRAAGAA